MKKIIYADTASKAAPLNVHPVLEKVFHTRGIKSDDELNLELSELESYHQLKGIDEAVSLLLPVVLEQESLLVVGDFDVDGASSVALVMQALRMFGAKNLNYLVPNRFEHGYGLSVEIVEQARAFKPDLIMTVDNGISSIEGVAKAQEYGIKVLISDHHLPAETLPCAQAIVNPNQLGCEFKSKAACGCAVAFYIMSALRSELDKRGYFDTKPSMVEFLDLVALATIADLVPLDKNNRILVNQGVRRIRAGKARAGIQALIQIAKRDYATLKSSDLGFSVGPRLNAAGRLDDMSVGIECLLSHSPATAYSLAQELNNLNQERRNIEEGMQQEALRLLQQKELQNASVENGLCLYEPSWHQGVIGILASRIKEQTQCPVIALADDDGGKLKGSARSIKGFHIRDALEAINSAHPNMLLSFGGHAMAAGLSLQAHNYAPFKQAFSEYCALHISPELLEHSWLVDADLEVQHVSEELACAIESFLPWGQGFSAPLFTGEFTLIEHRLLGQKHFKARLMPKGGTEPVEGICFNIKADKIPPKKAPIRLVYELDMNHFQGRSQLQLLIKDILF